MVATAVERVFDAKPINTILNHPTVRPSLGGDGKSEIDVASIIGNPLNIVLHHEGFAAIFLAIQPGMYEVHTQALPSARVGGTVAASAASMLQHMFCRTDALEITTRVPDGNEAARRLVHAMGFIKDFRVAKGWINGDEVEACDIYVLSVTRWMATARGMVESGKHFHEEIDAACARAAVERAEHPDDECHDRYSGAAFSMIQGGQVNKAVFYYNRWAAMAGYVPIAPISYDPPVVHIGEMAVRLVGDGRLEVVKCQ